jgi:hypothetical protein
MSTTTETPDQVHDAALAAAAAWHIWAETITTLVDRLAATQPTAGPCTTREVAAALARVTGMHVNEDRPTFVRSVTADMEGLWSW